MFPLPGPYRAAVFDLDGLLIDSEPLWGQAEAELVASRGGRLTDEDRRATIGRSIDATLEIHARKLGLPATAIGELRVDLLQRIRGLVATKGTIRPGAAELIDRLTGRMPIGLASNSDADLIALALERIGLAGRFDAVMSAAEVAAAKPAPDIYREILRRLAVDPGDAIGFEDSPSGVEALTAAGVDSVGVQADGPLPLDRADVVVDTLTDVLDWFD